MRSFRLTIILAVPVMAALWLANSNRSVESPAHVITGPNVDSSPDVSLDAFLKAPFERHADTNTEAASVSSEQQVAQVPAEGELKCSVECVLTLELLQLPYELGDAEYDRALATVDGLAEELKNNDELTQEFIALAVTTSGNKRQLIISTFMLLDASDRIALGLALSESAYRDQRLDGIQVLTNPATLDSSVVQLLAEIIATEQDHLVRSSAITALNRPDTLAGDQAVIDLLSHTIVSDNNPAVRGEALLASANLTDSPDILFNDALNAVRSGEPDYQRFAVLALEELIHRHITQSGLELGVQNDVEFKTLLAELMNPEHDDMPDDVRHAVDELYSRFF